MLSKTKRHIMLKGGESVGRGNDKCAYDHTETIMCRTKTKLKRVPIKRDRVALVMSNQVYKVERASARMITKRIPKGIATQVCILLDTKLACSDTIAPASCMLHDHQEQEKEEPQLGRPVKLVTATAPRGVARYKFKNIQDFGYALINVVYALWVFKSHGLVHGDIKLENMVLVEDQFKRQVFKLIDMASLQTRSDVHAAILRADKTLLGDSRGSEFCFAKAHSVWMTRRGLADKLLKKHNVDQQSVMEVLVDNIDMFRFALLVKNLCALNPKLGVKTLHSKLTASPGDFAHNPKMYRARLVVSDLCQAGFVKNKPAKTENESFATLQSVYSVILTTCSLDLPSVLPEYLERPGN